LRRIQQARSDALFVFEDAAFRSKAPQIIEFAVKARLAAVYGRREYVFEGGLIYCGTSYPELYRRAAVYVDKILKGTKPGDLPIGQPTKFDLVVNLKTAKALGITMIPHRRPHPWPSRSGTTPRLPWALQGSLTFCRFFHCLVRTTRIDH